jgi:hypothetical protein
MMRGARHENLGCLLLTIVLSSGGERLAGALGPAVGIDPTGMWETIQSPALAAGDDADPSWKGFIRLVFKNVDFSWDSVRGALGLGGIAMAAVLLPAMLFWLLFRSLSQIPRAPPDAPEFRVCSCGRLVSLQDEMCPTCGQSNRPFRD